MEEDDVKTNLSTFDLRRVGIHEAEFDGLGRPIGWYVNAVFDRARLPKDLYAATQSGAPQLHFTRVGVFVYGLAVPRLSLAREIAIRRARILSMAQEVDILLRCLRAVTARKPLFDEET